MERKILDCIGLQCPEPVIRTKNLLTELREGIVEVLVDNEASKSNVERFSLSQGCKTTISAEGSNFRVTITKTAASQPTPTTSSPVEEYSCEPAGGGLVYVIPSETMGQGSDDLGRLLLRGFIKTIREVSPLPAKILFFNSGVYLTTTESDLTGPLKELEKKGVGIYSCGTCLDYFNLKDKLLVGKVTNMYEIMGSMARAAKVVSPY